MAAMSPDERDDFYFTLQPIDALDMADWLREHHPDVFDLAADRVRASRALCATPRTALNAEEI